MLVTGGSIMGKAFVLYPLLPWLAFMILGWVCGQYLLLIKDPLPIGLLVKIGLGSLVAARWSVAAEAGALGEGMGVLTIIFLGLAALVVFAQVIPAVFMFGTMLVELFSPKRSKARREKKADQAV